MTSLPLGTVTAGYIDLSTGRVFGERTPRRNTFMYEGADIIGRLAAGQTGYVPNMAYVEFINDGIAPAVSVSREDGRSYYAGLETTGVPLGIDYLRVPLLFSPAVSASSAEYASNRVQWVVMSSGDTGVSGLAFSAEALSAVYGFALVSAPDVNDRTQDLVFARVYLETPLSKLATSQIHARWPYTFS